MYNKLAFNSLNKSLMTNRREIYIFYQKKSLRKIFLQNKYVFFPIQKTFFSNNSRLIRLGSYHPDRAFKFIISSDDSEVKCFGHKSLNSFRLKMENSNNSC